MMQQIDTVVFDLGGVLVDWNPDYVYRHVFSTEEEMRDFYKQTNIGEWNEEQDAGRSLQEGTELLVQRFPEQEKHIRMFYERWEEMLGGPIEGTVELLKKLNASGKYKTYALTNWSAETFPIALSRYDFLHWFHGRLVSGEEKTRKPFPLIYRLLAERFSINPHTAVYVDDNVRNLAPAKDMGFAVIHFQSPAQLAGELNKLGVPV